jgi:regulator of cell morphogenesis and NO signaling
MEELKNRTISELVSQDFVRASALFYLGVKFYDYQEATLAQVCEQKGLDIQTVLKGFDAVGETDNTEEIQLITYPVDLVIEYLKHTHYIFVKKKLPYIGQLIDGLAEVNFRYVNLAKDLKMVFPLFVEDFIEHVYEEEDILFDYINSLSKFLSGENASSKIYLEMENHSIQSFALDHGDHNNEMGGLRKITNDYSFCEEADLHIKVLFNELANFEKLLKAHAKIEDEILFPKALQLERMVKLRFHDLIKQN